MISFIIPVYNGEKYLSACLDSILTQENCEIELILIDDGSKDRTGRIMEEYAAKDGRIRFIRQENAGVSAARNKGASLARGGAVWFFDGDDILLPHAAEKMEKRLQSTKADIVIGNYYFYHEGKKEREKPAPWISDKVAEGDEKLPCLHLNSVPGNKLFSAAFLRRNALLFYPLRLGEDVSFYLRCVALAEKIAMLEWPVYDYRMYDGSSSRSYSLKTLDYLEAFRLVREFYSRMGVESIYGDEILYDELYYYCSCLNKLPLNRKKAERKKILNEYLRAAAKLECSNSPRPAEIGLLRKNIRRYEKYGWWYASSLYSFAYILVRKLYKFVSKIA